MHGQMFDVTEFVARHELDVDGPRPWQEGGQLWILRHSRMCDHHDGAAFIVQRPERGDQRPVPSQFLLVGLA